MISIAPRCLFVATIVVALAAAATVHAQTDYFWNATLGGANTYSGTTTVTGSYLFGLAQASGSPFSSGPVTLNGAGLRLNGLSAATTTTTVGDLTVTAPNNTNSGVSNLVVDNTGANG